MSVGLVLYDAYFVYKTDLMDKLADNLYFKVTEQIKFEIPLKLMVGSGGKFQLKRSVIGILDIMIPGFLAALNFRMTALEKTSSIYF